MCYLIGISIVISGRPREFDVPEVGKFIDIFAGVEMSFAKLAVLYYKRTEITELIMMLNNASLDLKTRAANEQGIKDLRDSYYFLEMALLIFTNFFAMVFQSIIFIQVLFETPIILVVPVSLNNQDLLTGPSTIYWAFYLAECYLCPFIAIVMTLCDVMIGNLYNQIILHLQVLSHDLQSLDQDDGVSEFVLELKFKEFATTYQSLHILTAKCEKCMRPFFINNVLATVLATTFSCVEVGIMINVDPIQCIKPIMYFLFITIPFFYWCWLGNRLSEEVSN